MEINAVVTRFFGSNIDNKTVVSTMIKLLLSLPQNGESQYDDVIQPAILQHSDCFQQWTPKSFPIERFLQRSREHMIQRCVRQNTKWMLNEKHANLYCNCEVPTHNELMDIIIKANSRCSLSGIFGTWGYTNGSSLFKLTFDHIEPISKNGTYRKDNLQAALNPINQLKGNDSDSEVTRFLAGFRNNYRYKCNCSGKRDNILHVNYA